MKSATNHSRLTRRVTALTAGITLVATGAIGAHSFADPGEGGGGSGTPPPGEPFVPDATGVPDTSGDEPAIGADELITTGGSTFDPTILTKYIPASAFHAFQGTGLDADLVGFAGNNCVTASGSSAGSFTEMKAPIELPDGSRIKRVSFFGADTDASLNVGVEVHREEYTSSLSVFPLPPTVSRSSTLVDAFSTSGSGGNSIVSGADNLDELTGSPSGGVVLLNFPNRFHSVDVLLYNANPGAHVLCGVKVEYQVAVSSADPGTVFHPVEPFRAFDSRQASFGALSGRLTPNSTKVVDITDGYDSNGVAIPAQADLVPSNATSITYNITVAGQTGPNFVAVTAGDAASFTASAINYTGSGSIANGSTVTLAADQTIKLWGGDNTGSAHVIIDVTGYSAPAPPPSNMGN